jgi:hypothetical protein
MEYAQAKGVHMNKQKHLHVKVDADDWEVVSHAFRRAFGRGDVDSMSEWVRHALLEQANRELEEKE